MQFHERASPLHRLSNRGSLNELAVLPAHVVRSCSAHPAHPLGKVGTAKDHSSFQGFKRPPVFIHEVWQPRSSVTR